MKDDPKREKKWKLLYTRSVKLARAKQLGFQYPTIADSELVHQSQQKTSEPTNILFICSRNQWRSPTAEKVWQNHPAVNVRSAGTSPNARRPVSAKDLQWAQVIFVMEEKHKSRLVAEYRRILEHKAIHVLDIPDEYQFMDAELVDQLLQSIGSILGLTHTYNAKRV